MKIKALFVATVVLLLIAVPAVSVFAFTANNGRFGAVGVSPGVVIQLWTGGGVGMTVGSNSYPNCGRWVYRDGLITIEFNQRAPVDLRHTTQILRVENNNTLWDGGVRYERLRR